MTDDRFGVGPLVSPFNDSAQGHHAVVHVSGHPVARDRDRPVKSICNFRANIRRGAPSVGLWLKVLASKTLLRNKRPDTKTTWRRRAPCERAASKRPFLPCPRKPPSPRAGAPRRCRVRQGLEASTETSRGFIGATLLGLLALLEDGRESQEAAIAAGWNNDALYSTVLVAALFNFYNRLADGVGLALPEGYPAEAGKRLSTQGYDVFAQVAKAASIAPEDLTASDD